MCGLDHWRRVGPALLAGLLCLGAVEEDLIGRPAEPWSVSDWKNGEPRSLEDLRGEVVLVRWWTAPGCPFCSATAPALNDFHRRYRDRGLRVLGFYHHKSDAPLDPEAVEAYARAFGFTFPIAIDPQWRTLKRWWLDRGSVRFTSVSFLIDRKGVVRFIHPGGQYAPGEPDHQELEAWILRLLRESA